MLTSFKDLFYGVQAEDQDGIWFGSLLLHYVDVHINISAVDFHTASPWTWRSESKAQIKRRVVLSMVSPVV